MSPATHALSGTPNIVNLIRPFVSLLSWAQRLEIGDVGLVELRDVRSSPVRARFAPQIF